MPCVDIAAKSKLFSLVVDTMETAKRILEINEQIKGGVINIYPLETMDQVAKPMKQIPAYSKSMLDIVSLASNADSRLKTLVDSIFGKVVLVRSYDEAMSTARDYNLTCITTDLQVVYAGAFLSKVGHYNRAKNDRFGQYQQLHKIKIEVEQMQAKLRVSKRDKDQSDLADLEAFRELQRSEVAMQQLK